MADYRVRVKDYVKGVTLLVTQPWNETEESRFPKDGGTLERIANHLFSSDPRGACTMQRYSGLIPHITVNSGAAAIDFYKAGLGAEEVSRMPAPDGRIMHAHVKIEGCSLFLSDDFPDHCGGVSRLPKGPLSLTLHVCVKDCDAAIARAVKAGASVQMPAADMFWGDRYGQIVDPFGYTWSFSHPLTAEQATAAQKASAGMKPSN